MCDFFWLSPADQGDLSDVVRASLQQAPAPAPHHRLPACSHGSLLVGCHHMPEEEELLPPPPGRVNCHDDYQHDEARSQQLVHGNGGVAGMILVGSNDSGCACDHRASLYPQHYPDSEGLLMIPQLVSGPQPRPCASSNFPEREDDAPVLDEHGLDAMATAPAIKRRKSQTKKVVCIPAPVAAPPGVGGRPSTSGEVVPSDLWAWRKYGQKPIKGSPYPRGYYRCSSSKGCSARKQVERSRTDPSMLVITYTSDHNHPWPTQRNALAGSTRPAAASSADKSHQHQQQRHYSTAPTPAAPDPTLPHRHADNVVVVADSTATTTPGSTVTAGIHHQQLLKQETVDMDNPKPAQGAAADHDLDMFVDMDGAIDVLCASSVHPKQQQHATAHPLEKLPEEEDKQLLLLDRDPFSFLDWVGASFGVGDQTAANNGGYYS
ncbi:hypothetical protein BS78_01G270900 [Paspalum vaginatum]|nr:hypothetical protein BS78_01G270900 [Paspalum vaginatum]